ncbi:hypothetical protein ACFCVQ_27030, partial [Bacillus thuringiensis]
IKYTNFNYSKNEFCKNVPFKREFQKRQHPMGLRATRDRKKFLFFFWYATWEGMLLFSCMMLFSEKRGNPLISILY